MKMFLCQGKTAFRTAPTLFLKLGHNNSYAMDIFTQKITGINLIKY